MGVWDEIFIFQKSDVDFDLFDSQYHDSLVETNFKLISGFYFDSNASKTTVLKAFSMEIFTAVGVRDVFLIFQKSYVDLDHLVLDIDFAGGNHSVIIHLF